MPKFYFFSFWSLILLSACSSHLKLGTEAYIKWVENEKNGLKVSKVVGPLKYVIQYEPIPYLVLIQNRDKLINDSFLNHEISNLEGMYYFKLRIETLDKNKDPMTLQISSVDDYHNRNLIFSDEFAENVRLVENGDTLHCEMFNLVNNYGLAPYMDLVLGFTKKKLVTSEANNNGDVPEIKVLVNDDVFNAGLLRFSFQKNTISKIPELSL